MRRILRAIFTAEGWHGLFTSELVAPWLWPLVMALLTGASQFLTDTALPVPYLIAAMAFVFACTSFGILSVNRWRSENTIHGKLNFSQITRGEDFEGTDASTAVLNHLQVGIRLQSSADFPILCRVDEIYSEIDSRVPKGATNFSSSFRVPPRGSGWFRPEPTEIGKPLEGLRLDGIIRYKVTYWREGRKDMAIESNALALEIFGKSGMLIINHRDAA